MGKWKEMKTREKTQEIKRENQKKKEDVKCENIKTALKCCDRKTEKMKNRAKMIQEIKNGESEIELRRRMK